MARTRTIWLAGLAILALTAAACSDDTSGTPPAGGGESTSSSAGGETSSAAGGGGAAEVSTSEVKGLGTILVDGEGFTLYLFKMDTGDTSTCTSDCSSTWPALYTDGAPTAGGDADASLLGTSDFPGGGTQVTYDGHPLYRYSGDQAPGDANGQEIGEIWYAVSPDGTPNEGEVGDDNGGDGGGDGGGY
jgi:predicted lipoprotein with Yx(FWY)xxD motif